MTPDVPWPEGRLGDQLRFLVDIDRLKQVQRRTYLSDGARLENTAEHSWHLAMLAIVLAEHAAEPVNLPRVVRMLLIHDIVEVDAGDTYIYDESGAADKAAREQVAAERIYGLLPGEQGRELRELWEEYEAQQSADARFAASCDRMQPMLLNYLGRGRSWQEHDVPADRVREISTRVEPGSPVLYEFVRGLVEDAVARGWLRDEAQPLGSSSDGSSSSASEDEA